MSWREPGRVDAIKLGGHAYVRSQDEDGNEIWLQGNPMQLGETQGSEPLRLTVDEFRAIVEKALF